MSINVTSDWMFDSDYMCAYAETTDPRVLAVIERDNDASFSQCLDGDAIFPTYMVESGRVRHIGGFDGDLDFANRVVEASDRFQYAAGYRYDGLRIEHIAKADEMLTRWAWIFHSTTAHRGNYGYQHAYDVLVLNTPEYRAHVGAEEQSREKAQEFVTSMSDQIKHIADGDVYGIGWATFEERVLDDGEPIDLDDWNIDIQCWGFVGDTYAQESAASWEAGAPELHPMLPID